MTPPKFHALSIAAAAAALLLLASGAARGQTVEGQFAVRSVPVFSISSTSLLFGETVVFSGNAVVKSRLATDPDTGVPSMIYQVNLGGVTARGLLSLRTFRVVCEETSIQPPTASTSFSHVFPYDSNGTFGLSLPATRYGTANYALNLDPATGTVSSVSVSLQSN